MSTPTTSRPSGSLAVAVVVAVTTLALGLVAALVGLYALAPSSARPDLGPIFQALGAGIPGAGGALLVYLNSRRQHAETTGNLSVITAQTNGVLTDRIAAGVAAALAARDSAAAIYVPPQPVPPSVSQVAAARATVTAAEQQPEPIPATP